MIKVCLIGVGKTGKEIAKMLLERNDMIIVSALCSTNSEKKNVDLGIVLGMKEIGIKIEGANKLEEVLLKYKPDVVVDFSRPDATLKNIGIIARMKINMVIGTTGFSVTELQKIEKIAKNKHIGIVFAPNITLGVNVLMILTKLATILLNSYDFQITEIHFKGKKDSPSGTALKIAKEIESGLLYAGKEIPKEGISINSVRAGGVVGKHEVLVVGEVDRITISHEAFSRKAFALGAMYAINFLENKTGFYEMKDVLCLSKVIEDLYIGKNEQDTKYNKKTLEIDKVIS